MQWKEKKPVQKRFSFWHTHTHTHTHARTHTRTHTYTRARARHGLVCVNPFKVLKIFQSDKDNWRQKVLTEGLFSCCPMKKKGFKRKMVEGALYHKKRWRCDGDDLYEIKVCQQNCDRWLCSRRSRFIGAWCDVCYTVPGPLAICWHAPVCALCSGPAVASTAQPACGVQTCRHSHLAARLVSRFPSTSAYTGCFSQPFLLNPNWMWLSQCWAEAAYVCRMCRSMSSFRGSVLNRQLKVWCRQEWDWVDQRWAILHIGTCVCV